MSFRKILLITGTATTAIGIFATIVSIVPFIDIPDYSQRGNIITGLVLSSAGIYILMLGIIENRK